MTLSFENIGELCVVRLWLHFLVLQLVFTVTAIKLSWEGSDKKEKAKDTRTMACHVS